MLQWYKCGAAYDLWYFYDTSCKIIQNVSFLYLIIYQQFISTFYQKMILWYFFHKKLFTYEHILNGKSKKYLIWNLTDTSFASFAPHALNQRSPARSGIENRWPKGKAKVKGVLLQGTSAPSGRVFKIYQFFDTFFASKYKLIHTKSTC